ncbi:MAG: sugar ABC transporter permease [Clostridia bacterium]|nr:sugar ABC transporter permease [Clostridia bacterium]
MIPLTWDIVSHGLAESGRFLAIAVTGVVILEGLAYIVLHRLLKYKYALPAMLIIPAFVAVMALIIYPFGFNMYLAFSNMSMYRFKEFSVGLSYGLQNFLDVFRHPVLQNVTFFQLLWRTVCWTTVNVFFHVLGGLFLAILLNRPMRGKAVYRTLLVVPWAIPQVIAALAWKGEFHYQYGFANIMLQRLGLAPIRWLSDPRWAFIAVILVNIWLGIPFMMVIILGGLQSISSEYYDAAQIDGASGWQQFRSVTMPLLQPVLTPAVILGIVWTFNNFNVIYLITKGGPMEGTDILVTSLYKAVFEFYRYGFGAAYAAVIFIILLVFAAIYLRVTGGFKGAWE